MLNIYLAGEIHSNWREEIISLSKKQKVRIKLHVPSN